VKKRPLGIWLATMLIVNITGTATHAASLFEDIDLEGYSGPYLVIKNVVNYRAKPDSDSKRLGQLSPRDIVMVKGRAKGTNWLAVTDHGEELGFVYISSITPLIDGSLNTPLHGHIATAHKNKPDCDYTIHYDGRAIEEATIFVSSDYRVDFACIKQTKPLSFNALMFMSEVPPDLGRKPIYQVTLNLPDIATGYEEYLSATALYDVLKQEVRMDNVSLAQFKEGNLKKSLSVENVPQALHGALQLQLNAFNTKAWNVISGDAPNPNELKPQ